jgi:hypothetical protein
MTALDPVAQGPKAGKSATYAAASWNQCDAAAIKKALGPDI